MNPYEQWLAKMGFNTATLDAAQAESLKAMYEGRGPEGAPRTPPNDPKPPVENRDVSYDDTIRAIEAEDARVNHIRTSVARTAATHIGNTEKIKQLKELGETAVLDKKVDARSFDLSLLRLDRTAGPIISTPRAPQLDNEVVEAAVCKSGGMGSLENHFSEQTLNAVDKHFPRGIGLHELIGMCAQQNGWRSHGSVKSNLRDAMKAAFSPSIDGPSSIAPTTLNLSGILSNTANKSIKDSWNAVDATWRKISAIGSVTDFKAVTSYSLSGDLTYDKVAPGGELKHGKLGEESHTNQADTYGKLIALDRRDVINDDLGAFSKISKRLGRGGALAINKVFWTEFLADHATFFPTDKSLLNYDSGADTVFGNDGLTNASLLWDAKTDPDGVPLAIKAKFLLTPPAHAIPALRLMNSQQLFNTSNLGDSNPWAGMWEVVSTSYLANATMGGGYSALAWYLIADPNELAVIETVFLNGVEMPTVEEVELAGDRLGMAWRAYHDFGVNKMDHRAGLKMAGA